MNTKYVERIPKCTRKKGVLYLSLPFAGDLNDLEVEGLQWIIFNSSQQLARNIQFLSDNRQLIIERNRFNHFRPYWILIWKFPPLHQQEWKKYKPTYDYNIECTSHTKTKISWRYLSSLPLQVDNLVSDMLFLQGSFSVVWLDEIHVVAVGEISQNLLFLLSSDWKSKCLNVDSYGCI